MYSVCCLKGDKSLKELKIGKTRLDRIELFNGEILQIYDIVELKRKCVIIDNSTPRYYQTETGQIFSSLTIKEDNKIDMLRAGSNGMGKNYLTLNTTVKDGIYGNLIGNTVYEYKEQIKEIAEYLKNKYGIVITFNDAKLKYIEINRTFKLKDEFKSYSRVLELILTIMPRMKKVNMIGIIENKKIKLETYGVISTRNGKRNKQYEEIIFYDKKSQLKSNINIELIGEYMRCEIKLKNAKLIEQKLKTNKLYKLTQDIIDEWFKKEVKKLIHEPLLRWKVERDTILKNIIKQELKKDKRKWQVNTLRRLSVMEIENKVPVILDVEELNCVIDDMPQITRKKRVKENFIKQAQKYEKVFVNNDMDKLNELLSKLTQDNITDDIVVAD